MARRPSSMAETLEPAFVGVGGPGLPEIEDDVEVDLEGPGPEMVDGALVYENEDGSVEIDFAPEVPDDGGDAEHGANLAAFMKSTDLTGLAEQLMQAVDDDRKSRSDWEDAMSKGIELMGLRIEDRTVPFQGACGVFDPLMAEAVIRWQAIARGELMPASGPVKTEIIGVPNEALEAQSARVKEWMNLYLTRLAPEYYKEFDQLLLWLPLIGSMFKKVYQDPVLARPVARMVTPDNFIVSYWTSDLQTSPRYTHVVSMTKRQMKQAVMAGQYLDIELGDPQERDGDSLLEDEVEQASGMRRTGEKPEEYGIYEIFADLDLKGYEDPDGIPLPYIVSVEEGTRKVLAVRRNWRADDPAKQKRDYFVHYRFLPGFGFYGLGYAHILGNSAKTATTIRRQLVDAGTVSNFPGGLRVKGMRLEDNNLGIGPMEFREIDTAGLPIQNAIMPLPYKEPSGVLLELLRETYEGARNLANTAEIAVGDGRQDAPVGTTVALMEAATRVQSATLKRAHETLGEELKMIADLFGEYLPEEPYPFPVRGGVHAIMREDFASNIDVIPCSDPNINSSAQRMMRAEALLRFATQQPDMHNLQEAFRQMYTEMGVDPMKIDAILPNPERDVKPADPLTENMRAIMQQPVKAAEYQDHDAHIAAHAPLAGENPGLQAHINEHLAFKVRVQVQQAIGVALPPPGEPLPPEIESQVAMMVAQAMQQLAPTFMPQPQEDPYVVAEREKIAAKKEIEVMKDGTKRLEIEAEVQSEAEDRELKRQIEGLNLVAEAQRNLE